MILTHSCDDVQNNVLLCRNLMESKQHEFCQHWSQSAVDYHSPLPLACDQYS